MFTAEQQIAAINRFASQIHPREELLKKLSSGKPLLVKYGIDPTAPDVHLGHTVPLRLLQVLQQFGHKAVVVIGNATARIGDPSGRDEARTGKTDEEIREHAARYLEQIAKVIDLTNAEVVFNDNWFGNMRFDEWMALSSRFTLQQIVERDDFNKRLNGNTPVYLHELAYPLMQAYDSVMVKADIEIGGTEQLFNMMVGRDLQHLKGQEPQVVITLPILRGTDGKRRMGKSLSNYIGIHETPQEMYAKVMSIPDDIVREWFTLLTDKPLDDIDATFTIHSAMNVKKILARLLVTQYHHNQAALKAEQCWVQQFSKKEIPEDVEEAVLPTNVFAGDLRLISLMNDMGLAGSLSEARRLITQGAVSLQQPEEKDLQRIPIDNPNVQVKPINGLVVKVGRKIRRLKLV